jgi:ribosomal protein L34E
MSSQKIYLGTPVEQVALDYLRNSAAEKRCPQEKSDVSRCSKMSQIMSQNLPASQKFQYHGYGSLNTDGVVCIKMWQHPKPLQ